MSIHIVTANSLYALTEMNLGRKVQTCITSPPYWGLRDYGTAAWEGGDPACPHRQLRGGNGAASAKQVTNLGTQGYQYLDVCGICGARRTDLQLGMEPTPDEYVQNLVKVLRQVRRCLRDDGTLWLNLGDTYLGGGRGWEWCKPDGVQSGNRGMVGVMPSPIPPGMKGKDLVGIPWRVALALQADGWYLRQDIIWHKPNPMPESVLDRCTKAHEYLFLLSKTDRYYFNSEAIQEPAAYPTGSGNKANNKYTEKGLNGDPAYATKAGLHLIGPRPTRNKRSVWTVNTKPYKGAHFATFPEKLIEPCVLAGSRPGSLVLDPFAGAGTTGLVAERHGRNSVLIELNPDYVGLMEKRFVDSFPECDVTVTSMSDDDDETEAEPVVSAAAD